jgi:holo-[acyl-carrier protein] synthase
MPYRLVTIQRGRTVIIGIGIDLVECGRFLDWSAFKKQRIFTKKELEYAENDNANAEKHLANFWAAREAFLKAIGTGFGDDIAFSDVSVIHNDAGRPELLISGGAKAALKDLAGTNANIHLSITDQDDYCAAIVVIESK